MLKSAIGYIRVSTEQQSGPDSYGVEAQRTAIQSYADENGYEIIEWKEDHISGVKGDRPAFNEILGRSVTNPPVQAVIAFKNDRIARDMKLYFYYQFLLEKKDIKLISTCEDFGEFGDFAGVISAMMIFVAEQERKNISMRTNLGRTRKATEGGYAGGKVPFGYSVRDGALIINEEEARVVRRIFSLVDSGTSYRKTASILNDEGLSTRSGKQFEAATVRSIYLNRKTYEGYYKYGNGDWVKGKHQPIIEEDLLG